MLLFSKHDVDPNEVIEKYFERKVQKTKEHYGKDRIKKITK